jgi:HAD superfamily hydrolase (TIGR01509 family)
MDGTLIDSEQAWLDAVGALAAASDKVLTAAQLDRLVGASMATTAAVLQDAGVTGSAGDIVRTLTTEVHDALIRNLQFRPGALELAASIAAAGVPQAIVSMSNRAIVDFVAGRSRVPFAVTVAGDDVARGKPHPDAYLLAAELLAVDAKCCVTFEDSANGLAAAVASGATAVAVPLYLPLDASAAAAEWAHLVGHSITDLLPLEPLSATSIIPTETPWTT